MSMAGRPAFSLQPFQDCSTEMIAESLFDEKSERGQSLVADIFAQMFSESDSLILEPVTGSRLSPSVSPFPEDARWCLEVRHVAKHQWSSSWRPPTRSNERVITIKNISKAS